MLTKLKPKSEFSRNVLTLMTGTTIAQAIPIAISPILTRIYTPEDFGVFALYMSATSLFSVLATGKYELAIMLPKKNEDSIYIAVLSIIIAVTICSVLFVLILFFGDSMVKIFSNKDISTWLYWVPISILLTSIYQSLNFLNIRNKEYKTTSTSKVLQSSMTSFTNVSTGLFGIHKVGLIIGYIVGQFLGSIYLLYIAYKNRYLVIHKFNYLKMIGLAKKYDKFPKLVTLTGFLNISSMQAPIIILTAFFTLKIVGFYSFAERILALPIALIGNSIGQVFFQKMSKLNLTEERAYFFQSTLNKLLAIGIPLFVLIIFFGDKIFSFAFGDQWIIAGQYAQILSIWLAAVFIVSPLSQLYNIMNKQHLFLKLNLLGFILRALSLVVGALFFNDKITLYLFSMSGVFIWGVILKNMLMILEISFGDIFYKIVIYFLSYIAFFYILRLLIGGLL